jgi:hypothetical protein
VQKKHEMEFHTLDFEHHDQAAAFLAALSRFLYSPQGAVPQSSPVSPRVWASAPASQEGAKLFLNDSALRAAEEAFPPVHTTKIIGEAALPSGSFLIIEAGRTPPLGAAQASAGLKSRSAL